MNRQGVPGATYRNLTKITIECEKRKYLDNIGFPVPIAIQLVQQGECAKKCHINVFRLIANMTDRGFVEQVQILHRWHIWKCSQNPEQSVGKLSPVDYLLWMRNAGIGKM